MKYFFLLGLLLYSFLSFAQLTLSGNVKDRKGVPVFAANVYVKSMPQKGTTTGFDGEFSLTINRNRLNDLLIISFIGYETMQIETSTIDFSKKIIIELKEASQTLEAIIITSQDPISEQFSVVKMSKMDIYLNPVSQGDPLKAITVLPASTTTNETANVSLRGSAPDRSRIILNGVPIYNPVRASQLNNQGFFSLFNPEIIEKQYVYASNPPLTYGNTSAGLVEIQTIKTLELNQLQLSVSLASAGLFISQKIKKETSFIQVYGNFQFSDAFVGIQKEKLPNINHFYTKDAGLNFYSKIGKKVFFNSYNYTIDEQFSGYNEQFTYKGDVVTNKRRFFTVNNLTFYSEKGVLSLNSSFNSSNQHFSFGNIKSDQKINQTYTSLNYKWHVADQTDVQADVQFGISYDAQHTKFNDSIPVYYYALSPNSPNYFSQTAIQNHIIETYLYSNWDMNEKFTFLLGIRNNIPVENQKNYLSTQLGIKYRLNPTHSFLISGGKYHNYATPNFFLKNYPLLASHQLALDYTYQAKNTLIKAASYFKNETGEQVANAFFTTEKVNTYGLEFYIEHTFKKYFKISFANSFINQVITINDNNYSGNKDFNYLIKTTLQYNNPTLFSLALTYLGWPGTHFTEITGGTFDHQTNFYEPMFSSTLFDAQYGAYNRFDINWSKYIKMNKHALITFISVNNIFNKKNERDILFNADYSAAHFDNFQLRTFYFGCVWQWNY